jgi:excisionase family DNA binding protein
MNHANCECQVCEFVRVQQVILRCLRSIEARLSERQPSPSLAPSTKPSKLLYSPAEVAELLGISIAKIRLMIYRRELASTRIGRLSRPD